VNVKEILTPRRRARTVYSSSILCISALNYTPKLTITAEESGEADSPSERQRDTDAAPSRLDSLLLLHPLRLSVSALNYTPN